MKKRSIALITSLLLTTHLLSACGKSEDSKQENTVRIAVETETIESKNLEQYITVSSRVKANNEVSVIPKISGIVKSVNVKLGDYVKKGDILFTIDDKDIRLQLNQAQASLKSAEANYNLTVDGNIQSQIEQLTSNVNSLEIQYEDIMTNLKKMEELYEAGAVAENEVDKLRTSADTVSLQLETAKKSLELTQNNISAGTEKVASSGIEQAKAGLDIVQSQLNNTVVRAEIDGVIANLNVSEGQMASPQAVAMTISDMDNVKLSFQVSEDAIKRIDKGSKVYITVQAVSDTAIESEVSNVSKVADTRTSLYPVEVNISNTDQIIKPGMFASIKLILNDKENIITLPLNTVIYKNDEAFVYTVDANNITHKTIVKTGISNDEDIEITSGLSLGNKVVVKGQDFISDGLEVNVVEKTQDK